MAATSAVSRRKVTVHDMTAQTGKKDKGAGEALTRCASCGYEGGFHVLLDAVGGGKVKVRLKCPNCYKVYDRDVYFFSGN